MNLTVNLAGFPAVWRFGGSPALDAWVRDRLWQKRNELQVVRVAAGHGDRFLAGLRQAVRAADDGASGVRLHDLPADDLHDGLAPAVSRLFEIPRSPNPVLALKAVADRLAGPPAVLLVPPPEACPQDFALEAGRWLDKLNRQSPSRVSVVLFDTPRQRLAPRAHDLTVGLPADGALAEAAAGTDRLWRAYLHNRLAWEAAGDLGRASEWDRRDDFRRAARAEGRPGADEEFERAMNDAARDAYEATGGQLRVDVREYLTHLLGRTRPPAWLANKSAELERAGLLWRPPGDAEARPAPWLARALLLKRDVPDAALALRGCLVCAPLAHELLNRCFDLEAHERAACWATREGRLPPPEAVRRYNEFEAGRAAEAMCYPAGCPARPDDPWPFTTFGEFLSAMAGNDPRRQAWYDLLHLRNVIAHGNYVCWRLVERLREIEAKLRG